MGMRGNCGTGLQSGMIAGVDGMGAVFRTIRILGCWMKEGIRMFRKCDEKAEGHPLLEEFTTLELKRELRRRRREGGWLRWVLWRLGWM